MKLSIVIPAHNEEHRLPPVLRCYAEYFFQSLENDFEILVVVNGSTDRTAEAARSIAEDYPQIRVIEEPGRIGKGGAIILGAKAAQGEWIGFVDADGATTAEEFDRLCRCTQNTDGVIASRWKEGAQVNVQQKGLRLLSSRLFNGLIRLVLGLRYEDTQCGAKIFTAKAWRTILPNIGTTRFAFDVDLLFQLKRHGFRILEEPTVWSDVEGSKVRFFNSSAEMFFAVIRMRLVFSPFKFVVRWYEYSISGLVDYLLKDKLFRHTLLLFSASIITMVCNMGFQMVVGRALPASEYALLATFLALFAIIQRPLGTLAIGLNHYVSLMLQDGRDGLIPRLLRKWVLITSVFSVLTGIVCLFYAKSIAAYFHLERVVPVVVCSLALPGIFICPVLGGALSGMQRFAGASAAAIFGALARVGSTAVFVWLVYAAAGWALLGHVIGLYVTLLVVAGFLFSAMPKHRSASRLPHLRFYLAQSFFVQLAVAVLLTADVIFMKHYLPMETGFSKAATLGRLVAFMAISVAGALFPKVSSAGEFSHEHRSLYLRALLYTGGFIGISLSACLLFPDGLLRVLFGIDVPTAELIAQTRGMALAMAPATLLNVNVSLLLAQRRFLGLLGVVVIAIVYIVGIHFMHASVSQIIWWCGLTNLTALGWTTVGILNRPKGSSCFGNESGNEV